MIFNQNTKNTNIIRNAYDDEKGTQTGTAVHPLIEADVVIAVRSLTSPFLSPLDPQF